MCAKFQNEILKDCDSTGGGVEISIFLLIFEYPYNSAALYRAACDYATFEVFDLKSLLLLRCLFLVGRVLYQGRLVKVKPHEQNGVMMGFNAIEWAVQL